MSTTGSLAGAAEVVRALATIRREIHPVLAGTVKDVTRETKYAARADAPVRTGTTVNAISETFFDDGLTGVVFTAPRDDPNYNGGWRGATWRSRGFQQARQRRRPAQFPLWLEYGTVHMRSRPYLYPAFRGKVGEFDRRAVEAVRRLVKAAE